MGRIPKKAVAARTLFKSVNRMSKDAALGLENPIFASGKRPTEGLVEPKNQRNRIEVGTQAPNVWQFVATYFENESLYQF